MTGDHPKSLALQRTARRVVLLFLLGLIYNGLLQFHFDTLRVPGVLQRIAICYGLPRLDLPAHEGPHPGDPVRRDPGGLLGDPDVRSVARVEAAGDLTKETNLAGYLDRHYLPGKIYESLLRLRRQRRAALDDPGSSDGTAGRAGGPVAALGPVAGPRPPAWRRWGWPAWAWACSGASDFPIIKILWTSTYVLVAGGWSLLLLALFYTIIDVIKLRAWAFFFVVIGVNAITIYVATHFIPFETISQYIFGGAARLSGCLRPVVVAIGDVAIEWLFLLHLYRNRIFLRV